MRVALKQQLWVGFPLAVEQSTRAGEPEPCLADHLTILFGGAVGGFVAPIFVALFIVPYNYSSADLGSLFCCGIPGLLLGYLPGITAWFTTMQRARMLGFILAAVAGALFTGFVSACIIQGISC
jgi:hypothetical protein